MWLDGPACLGHFCSILARSTLSNPAYVIRELTPYHYFVSCMPLVRRKQILEGMLTKSEAGPTRRVNRSALIPPLIALRLCLTCHEEDVADPLIGAPYWRRSHQLPFVLVCTKHRKLLKESNVAMRHGETDFKMPPDYKDTGPIRSGTQPLFDEAGMSILMDIAAASDRLLNPPEEGRRLDGLVNSHRTEARRLGLIIGNRLQPSMMALSFKDTMEPILKAIPHLLASDGYPSWWLLAIFRNEKVLVCHPFLHIIVDLWLARAKSIPPDDPRLRALDDERSKTRGRGQIRSWRTSHRDTIMSARVEPAAQEIRKQKPPIRVTRSALARTLGVTTLRAKRIADEHWPISSSAIDAAIETSEEYFKRRIDDEINRLITDGKVPLVHMILSRLGRHDKKAEVARAISDSLDRNLAVEPSPSLERVPS